MFELASARPDPDSRLEILADIIDKASASAGFGVRSTLYFMGDCEDPASFDFGMLDLDGESPTEALLGMVAKEEWWALGASTGGWAAPMGEGRPSNHPEAVRVRMTLLGDREGRMVARQHFADGRQISDAPGGGLMVDGIRRAFSLATDPPAATTAELLTRLWLSQVAGATHEARSEGRRVTWSRAIRLHPALRMLESAGERTKPDRFIEVAGALARVLTWDDARTKLTATGWFNGVVTRDIAAWMDAGMFSRWVLGEMPTVQDCFAEIRRGVAPDTAQRLDTAVKVLLATDDCAGCA